MAVRSRNYLSHSSEHLVDLLCYMKSKHFSTRFLKNKVVDWSKGYLEKVDTLTPRVFCCHEKFVKQKFKFTFLLCNCVLFTQDALIRVLVLSFTNEMNE